MVELNCCATLHIRIIFVVNIILFIGGVVQIRVASYFLVAGSDDFGFVSAVFQENDGFRVSTLALGVLFVIISWWGCCGANRRSKCMLWVYAFVLFFFIMGQSMTVVVLGVAIDYGDAIFADMWKQLQPDNIDDIENTYQCCSFNGNSSDTWFEDAARYQNCTGGKVYNESCWQKFEGDVNENYDMIRSATAIFLGVQILIYFSTHYVIQSIAKAEGDETAEKVYGL